MPNEDIKAQSLVELSSGILAETRTNIVEKNVVSIPIAQLSTLGSTVASLLPSFRTMTQSSANNAGKLYRLVNAGVGDALKVAKNGNSWGAIKTASGGSRFAQFQSVADRTVMPVNPTTIMIVAALYSIEKQIKEIADTARAILTFLEIEKESEIEADMETLMSIIANYKHNWDNAHYVESNHKMILDIQRTARKNMLTYQKTVAEMIKSKRLFVLQSKVKSELSYLVKRFKYYRMALYIFAMSSLSEIMLGGNFRQEYIAGVKAEVDAMSKTYLNYYEQCSAYVAKVSSSAFGTSVIRGIGATSDALGRFIGSIPLVKKGQADEFLQEKGDKIKCSAQARVQESVDAFGQISDPKTTVFTEKMNEMVQIFNHTSSICFDNEQIYLIEEQS